MAAKTICIHPLVYVKLCWAHVVRKEFPKVACTLMKGFSKATGVDNSSQISLHSFQRLLKIGNMDTSGFRKLFMSAPAALKKNSSNW
jgi:hypothetical protein